MCDILLPPGVNPIAVKLNISYTVYINSAGNKLTHEQPWHSPPPCRPEHVPAYPWRSLQQNGYRQVTAVQQVSIHFLQEQTVTGRTASWRWRRLCLPHMMSSVHFAMYGHTSKPWDPTSVCNLLTSISLCSENTSMKLSRILKWKVGVIIFLCGCHIFPGESRLVYQCDIPLYFTKTLNPSSQWNELRLLLLALWHTNFVAN
jgi:hypothetical protein